ncbi:MAG: hypothetical protein LUG85_06795 [Clostridiales bacterium]|nr:hypothetical protein [Clostridiales bacterium]
MIAALGHTDDDEDGVCDVCGESLAEDEEEEETSLWDSIHCSMCDAYEAFADIPVIGTLMQIVHMFVHLARYIAYIT